MYSIFEVIWSLVLWFLCRPMLAELHTNILMHWSQNSPGVQFHSKTCSCCHIQVWLELQVRYH